MMTQDTHGEVLTMEEFCARFKAYMLSVAGRETFDDGSSIADYADMTSSSYFEEQHQDGLNPEECASADISYWGEE